MDQEKLMGKINKSLLGNKDIVVPGIYLADKIKGHEVSFSNND